MKIFRKIAGKMPALPGKLEQAGMTDSAEDFVKKTFISAFYLNTGIVVFIAFVMSKTEFKMVNLLLIFPILMIMLFFYFLKFPDMQILKREREIDKEIVYAGQHLIIELQSGISLYDSFQHIADNYPNVGKHFRNIVEDIDLGTPIDEALNRAVEMSPSHNLRKILWQIINSITTGVDVASSLEAIIEQVVRDQKIQLNEYGRKLNPLAMFYMIIAVVLPSIGITMFTVLLSFVSVQLSLTILLIIAGFMGFMQFMFYTVVKSARPPGDIE